MPRVIIKDRRIYDGDVNENVRKQTMGFNVQNNRPEGAL